MASYQAPGVYIRYVTEGPLTIRAASTSTAVFIGRTRLGAGYDDTDDNFNRPPKVTTAREYAEQFANIGCNSGAVSLNTENTADDDFMGFAVSGFFANGGTQAYIVSTNRDSGANAATGTMQLGTDGAAVALEVQAKSAGTWGNDVSVQASLSESGPEFVDIEVSLAYDGSADNRKIERFVGIDRTQVVNIISALVDISIAGAGAVDETLDLTVDPPAPITLALTGGANPNASAKTYANILEELQGIDDISLIVLPDREWSGGNGAPANARADINQAITHAQAMKDRMVLAQVGNPPDDWSASGLPVSQFVSAYYPKANAIVKNGAGKNQNTEIGLTGHIAGVIARTDAVKGAWTAAAGVQADVKGIASLTRDISSVRQEAINSNNVNAIRYINGAPSVWGARTRDTNGIYEYQPVTRTAFLIADSLRAALQRVVFQKNTEVLWINLKASVSGFLTTLYAQGAFQGGSASEAFEVACGLNESMSQTEIDQGLLRVTVRFRPAKPAEFVEVSVEQLFENS